MVYNYGDYKNYQEKIVRYKYKDDTLIEPFVILDNILASSIHNGSRLLVTKENLLLMTTGDSNQQLLAQDTFSLNGKLL